MTDELVLVVPRSDLFGGGSSFQGFAPSAEGYLRRIMGGYFFMPRARAETDPAYKQIIPYVVLQAPGPPGRPHHYMIFQRVQGGDPRLGRLYSIGLGGHINSGDVLLAPPAGPGGARARGELRRRRAAGTEASPAAPVAATPKRVVRQITLAPTLRDLVQPLTGPSMHDHPLLRGIRRELREEVLFPPGAQLSLLGAINDDGNGVGSVHFGLVFLLQVPPTVKVRQRRTARRSGFAPVSTAPRREAGRIRLRPEVNTVQVGDLLPLDHVNSYRHAMESWSTLILDAGVLPQVQPGGRTGRL